MKRFLTRSDIGLRPPRSVSYNVQPERGGVCLHYGGPAQKVRNHSDCLARWRGWQGYHMDVNDWVDIAYTLGTCDHGYVLAGRGYGVRTAAQGTNDGNLEFMAIAWIGGQGETPTQEAYEAAAWGVQELRRLGAGRALVDHSSFRQTVCAGPRWRSWIPNFDAFQQEDDMPLTDEDVSKIAREVWGFISRDRNQEWRLRQTTTASQRADARTQVVEAMLEELLERQGVDPNEIAEAVATRVDSLSAEKVVDRLAERLARDNS